MTSGVQVVILSGVPGVGKTTTAEAMSDILRSYSVAHAWLDGDQLGLAFPRSPTDPHAEGLFVKNLSCIWANYAEAGVERFIVARVVETAEGVDAYRDAIPGADVTVVELRASSRTVHGRIAQREYSSDWVSRLQDRSDELRPALESNGVAHFVVSTQDATPDEVARTVLELVGWIG